MPTLNKHWNNIFTTCPDTELGWYEKDVSQTLKFLDQIPQGKSTTVFIPGVGTSTLADQLVNKGYKLILNDISNQALDKIKNRIGTNSKVTWLPLDISKPFPDNIPLADIWIDRAVLHFLFKEADIQTYFDNLYSVIRQGGYVLLAEFSINGAPKCAGLELHRYSIEEMTQRMGAEFKLIRHEEYTYTNPAGEPRPYIYALYKRQDD